MAQLEQKCLSPVQICRLRITKLDSLGQVVAGPNNAYVTDKVTEIQPNPTIRTGDEINLPDGCGCDIVNYKNDDVLIRWELALTLGALEPALQSLLLGGDLIYDDSDTPVPIGWHWPLQAQCSTSGQPNVAVEAWSKAIDYDHPDPDLPWFHFIWPWAKFQIGQFTLGNSPATMPVNGFTRQNPNWLLGPYGDAPEAVAQAGSVWLDTSVPDATCGFITAGS